MLKKITYSEQQAQELLTSLQIDIIPTPLDPIAKRLGIILMAFDLGSNVSGVLRIEKNSSTIGYNPNESKVRQRFTIAHEIGHFILHKKEGNNGIFIDNGNHYNQILFRAQKSQLSEEDDRNEQEANEFAAALLMPRDLINKELNKYQGFDLSDNSMIVDLAKKFEVSIPAMTFRIINITDINKV